MPSIPCLGPGCWVPDAALPWPLRNSRWSRRGQQRRSPIINATECKQPHSESGMGPFPPGSTMHVSSRCHFLQTRIPAGSPSYKSRNTKTLFPCRLCSCEMPTARSGRDALSSCSAAPQWRRLFGRLSAFHPRLRLGVSAENESFWLSTAGC